MPAQPRSINALEKYHLEELRIASDPYDARHLLPTVVDRGRLLDLGCGAGQIILALDLLDRSVGLDLDARALSLGKTLDARLHLVNASVESLPFSTAAFTQVVARGTLPYTDIRRALAEARRVLAPGGRLWMSLHDFWYVMRQFRGTPLKARVFLLYVMVNGFAFHLLGRTFSFVDGQRESFQTRSRMRAELRSAGFGCVSVMRRGRHFVIEAQAE